MKTQANRVVIALKEIAWKEQRYLLQFCILAIKVAKNSALGIQGSSDLNTKYPMNLMVHELTYSLPLPRSWLKHNIYEELDSEEILSLGEAEDP